MPDSSDKQLNLEICVSYPDFELRVARRAPLSGITGVSGVSGAGKSTLLRAIAGFEPSISGRIEFSGECWQDSEQGVFVKSCHRPVGFVFQDARLFTHLDVAGNLHFAEQRQSSGQSAPSVDDVVAALGVGHLLARDVVALSGGERQRVAIARTLLSAPALMLMDEPLASLDVSARRSILRVIEALPHDFHVPVLYVSHSVEEVARLSDTVLVIDQGTVVADDTVERVFAGGYLGEPATEPNALSLLPVIVKRHRSGQRLLQVAHEGQLLSVTGDTSVDIGASMRLVVRASDVIIATVKPSGLSVRNCLHGEIADIVEQRDKAFATVVLNVGSAVLRSDVTRDAITDLGLRIGSPAYALIKAAALES